MALIYGDASRWDAFSADEREAVYAKYRAFADEAREAGVMVGGAELASTARRDHRARPRRRDARHGRPLRGGERGARRLLRLRVETMDEAVEYAAKIPGAEHGAVEVRPIYVDERKGQS